MHPDDIIWTENLVQGVAKALIDVFILLPIFSVVNRELSEIVKKRPERRVTEAEIEPLHLLFGEKYRIGTELVAGALDQRSFECLIDAGSGQPTHRYSPDKRAVCRVPPR